MEIRGLSFKGLRLGQGGWSGRAARLCMVTLVGVFAACGDDPFQVVQVITEVEFDSSLNIDLSAMELLPSGVYQQDLVVGTGDTYQVGMTATVGYTGWLTTGVSFDSGELTVVGDGSWLAAFEDGVVGMQVGGTRRIIIPPALGYGDRPLGVIPAGSILIFDLVLVAVS